MKFVATIPVLWFAAAISAEEVSSGNETYKIPVVTVFHPDSTPAKWSETLVINITGDLSDAKNVLLNVIRHTVCQNVKDSLLLTHDKNQFLRFYELFGNLLTYEDMFLRIPSKENLLKLFDTAADEAFGSEGDEAIIRKKMYEEVTAEEIMGLFNGNLSLSFFENCRASACVFGDRPEVMKNYLQTFDGLQEGLQTAQRVTQAVVADFQKKKLLKNPKQCSNPKSD